MSLMTFKVLPAQFQGRSLREADDEAFGRNPIGSGPYQYHGTVKQGDTPQAVFIANPFYQRPGRPSRPRIKEIHLVVPRDPVGDF